MRVKNSHELKQLQTRRDKLRIELGGIEGDQKELASRWKTVRKKLNSIEKQIQGLEQREITISEHALLRYLERVKGINLDELREEILTDKVKSMIDELSYF